MSSPPFQGLSEAEFDDLDSNADRLLGDGQLANHARPKFKGLFAHYLRNSFLNKMYLC